MVLHVCGESISVPTYISNWVKESEDHQIEFKGMVESIVWAAKKSVVKDDINESTEGVKGGFSEFMNAYTDLLKAISGSNEDDEGSKNNENPLDDLFKNLFNPKQ